MKSPLIAASILCFAAPAAFAASATTTDFDLAVTVDRTALDEPQSVSEEYENIREQITEQCKAEHQSFSALQKYIAVKKCVSQTLDRTVQTIDHANLTSFHAQERLG